MFNVMINALNLRAQSVSEARAGGRSKRAHALRACSAQYASVARRFSEPVGRQMTVKFN